MSSVVVLATASLGTAGDRARRLGARLYLAQRGIRAYGSTDRYAYELLGYRRLDPGVAMVMGAAPIRAGPGRTAIIGNQPVEIRLSETIVAQWTDRQSYPWQYNDAAWRYFASLNDLYDLKLHLVKATADAGQVERVIAVARAHDARLRPVPEGSPSLRGPCT